MSTKKYEAKHIRNEGSSTEVASSPRFLKGLGEYLHAIRENRVLRAENERLLHDSTHDELTGLPNRRGILIEARKLMDEGIPFGVVCGDVNGFKTVNDTLGHAGGDQLLIGLADRLASSLKRHGDAFGYVARMGGDEFFTLYNLRQRGPEDNTTLEQRLKSAVDFQERTTNEFFSEQPSEVSANCSSMSLGAAIWDPEAPVDEAELFRQADEAMYRAKAEVGKQAR